MSVQNQNLEAKRANPNNFVIIFCYKTIEKQFELACSENAIQYDRIDGVKNIANYYKIQKPDIIFLKLLFNDVVELPAEALINFDYIFKSGKHASNDKCYLQI